MKVDPRQLWEAIAAECGELGLFELMPIVDQMQDFTVWDSLPVSTRELAVRIARRLRPVP